jgi:hypothetical protein
LDSSFVHAHAYYFRLWVNEAKSDTFLVWRLDRLSHRPIYSYIAGHAVPNSIADTCSNRDQVFVDALGSQKPEIAELAYAYIGVDLSNSNHLRKVGGDRMVVSRLTFLKRAGPCVCGIKIHNCYF